MSAKIEVDKIGDHEFQVRVIEGATQTSHAVTLKKPDYERITAGKIDQPELVKRAFEFLLENEPKESILARFDLMVIGRYFPNFEREMKRRISEKTWTRKPKRGGSSLEFAGPLRYSLPRCGASVTKRERREKGETDVQGRAEFATPARAFSHALRIRNRTPSSPSKISKRRLTCGRWPSSA
jgi:hypothetical protein